MFHRYVRIHSLVLFAASITFCISTAVHAQVPGASCIWTTAGSAGTVDETDVSKVFLDHAIVQSGHPIGGVSTAAAQATPVLRPTTSAVIRYNITPVEGLFVSGGMALQVRYLDVGSDARVVVKVIQVDMASGLEKVRVTFDSNTATASTGYTVGGAEECVATRFDFIKNGYYVEATLTRSSVVANSAAGIQLIKITPPLCLK
ncbi:MAG: hypothetical protein QOF63_777 [Thermoanaerobaculia bacterium]|jgi:hypothetical protein|nr:hypothetical protein [Thermoanaerobaculia bacterium]